MGMNKKNKAIGKTIVMEIVELHNEIVGSLRMCLPKAIKAGELLTAQKDSLKHGEWLPWIEENLPFTRRTASNYIRCYDNRGKWETVSHLKDAYKLLEAPKKKKKYTSFSRSEAVKWFKEWGIFVTGFSGGVLAMDFFKYSVEDQQRCIKILDRSIVKLQKMRTKLNGGIQ